MPLLYEAGMARCFLQPANRPFIFRNVIYRNHTRNRKGRRYHVSVSELPELTPLETALPEQEIAETEAQPIPPESEPDEPGEKLIDRSVPAMQLLTEAGISQSTSLSVSFQTAPI